MPNTSTLDTVLKAVGMVGAAAGWVYQARATVLRGKIRADLEILEKARTIFGADNELPKRIEAKAGREAYPVFIPRWPAGAFVQAF